MEESFQPTGRRGDDKEHPNLVKCRHNDRSTCNRGESCHFFHSKTLCKIFSKYAECENQDTCMKRHPNGVCSKWKNGRWRRDLECIFRHPVDTSQPPANTRKSPEKHEDRVPRKRRLSSQQEDPNKSAKLASGIEHENRFLFQKYRELEQKVDTFQIQKETIPQGWMNTGWVRPTAPVVPQLSALQRTAAQPAMINHNLVQWNHPQGRFQPVYQVEQNLCQYPSQLQ